MIKIYDGRKGFYQWDLDQKLIIGFENDCRVHFYNPRRLSNTALVVETYMIGDKKVADVPNALLQHDGTLVAWVYKTVGDKCTVEQAKFAVQKRQKPDDYVYTPTEVFDFEELKREVEGKITMPDGGEVGNVLKKTADGAEWGEDSEGKVNSVNGVEPDESGNVQLDASDVGALPDDTFIPTKTSELENDSGFLTEHQSLSAYRTAVEQDAIDEGKVDVEEGKGLSANDFTDTLKEKLDGIADDADNTKAVLTDTAAAAWTEEEKAAARGKLSAADSEIVDARLDKTDESLDLLWKLTKGQAWDVTADNTKAYQKTIPSGTHLSVLNGWGGKTIVWNQIVSMGGFAPSTTINGVTFTKNNDGTITVNGTATDNAFYNSATFTNTIGHSYLLFGCPENGSASSYALTYGGGYKDIGDGFIVPSNASSVARAFTIAVYSGTIVNNMVFAPRFIDFTKLLGAGNEPSTMDDPIIDMIKAIAQDRPGRNEGELLSADVVDVVEHGKNLFDEETLSDFNEYVTIQGGYKYTDFIKLEPNTTYKYKTHLRGSFDASVYYVLWIGTEFDNQYIKYPVYNSTVRNETFTTREDGYIRFGVASQAALTEVLANVDIQVEKGSASTDYKPYHLTHHTIPDAVQALDGYGWSAGTAYNSIEYDATQSKWFYHKRVGSVDLGSINYSRVLRTTNYAFEHNIADGKETTGSTGVGNAVCAKYGHAIENNGIRTEGIDKVMAFGAYYNAGANVRIVDNQYETPSDFKTAMSGVMLYYELATEVVTDITDLFPADWNYMESVEAGGTLTFVNSHGDDYRIPVPSNIDHYRNLSEVTP